MSRALLAIALLTGCEATVDDGIDDPVDDPTETVLALGTMTPEEVAAHLSDVTGCSDVALFAGATDGTALLELSHQGMVEHLYATMDEDISDSWALPAASVTVKLLVGSGLRELPCNDAITDNPVIADELDAVAGSVELTVVRTSDTYEAWDMPADAEARLVDVVLESPTTGARVEVGELILAAHVGWLPG